MVRAAELTADLVVTPRPTRRLSSARVGADGRFQFLARRPIAPATLAIALSLLDERGIKLEAFERALVLADDSWRVDLGDLPVSSPVR